MDGLCVHLSAERGTDWLPDDGGTNTGVRQVTRVNDIQNGKIPKSLTLVEPQVVSLDGHDPSPNIVSYLYYLSLCATSAKLWSVFFSPYHFYYTFTH